MREPTLRSADELLDEPTLVRRAASPPDPDREEEGDEEAGWVEPFSLLENLVRERFRAPTHLAAEPAVEVIQHAGRELVDILQAAPGGSVHVGADRFCLLTHNRAGGLHLFFRDDFKGTVFREGKPQPLGRFRTRVNRTGPRDDRFVIYLREGDFAQVQTPGGSYLIRFVQPPALPKGRRRVELRPGHLIALGASAGCHALLLVALLGVSPAAVVTSDQPRPPEPTRIGSIALDPVVETPSPSRTTPRIEETSLSPRRESSRPSRPGRAVAGGRQARRDAIGRVMDLLRPQAAGPARTDLGKLTRSIGGVRSSGSAPYIVSAPVSRFDRGGGGGLGWGGGRGTFSGGELLPAGRGGPGALSRGRGPRGPRVRMPVTPPRFRPPPSVHYSSALIQQVISRHLSEIQGCYERLLIAQPDLAGKIVVDWVIAPDGGVTVARLHTSTARNPALPACVLDRLRRFRFPPPRLGSIEVRHPFIFEARGF